MNQQILEIMNFFFFLILTSIGNGLQARDASPIFLIQRTTATEDKFKSSLFYAEEITVDLASVYI